MTDGIVQADLELARRLIEAECQDSAIVAWLSWRGVEPTTAARLVDDLRHGRQVALREPCPASELQHSRSPSVQVKGGRRGRRAAVLGALPNPLQFLRHHRHGWWHRLSNAVRWGFASMACLTIFGCFLYVGYSGWEAIKLRSAAFRDRYPNHNDRVRRDELGLPEALYDFGEPKQTQTRRASSTTLPDPLANSSTATSAPR